MVILTRSSKVALRRTTPDDLEFVLRLESNEENKPYIIPWGKERHENAIKHEDMEHLIVEHLPTNRPAGYVILAGLQNSNQSIELVRIVMHDKGKGLGKYSIKLVKRWAFEDRNANRLWLDVKVDNHRAKRVYESEGFLIEGTLRECLKTGDRFESLHVMSILKSEYRA